MCTYLINSERVGAHIEFQEPWIKLLFDTLETNTLLYQQKLERFEEVFRLENCLYDKEQCVGAHDIIQAVIGAAPAVNKGLLCSMTHF